MAGKTSYPRRGISGSGFRVSSFNIPGSFICILAAIVLLGPLGAGYLRAAEGRAIYFAKGSQSVSPKADSGPARYRVFFLKHISAEKGKEYLAEVKIGTVSQLPGANMLLVTAQPRELIKASAILRLVDSEKQFAIRTISPASPTEDFASGEQIAARLKGRDGILIGTFSNPPTGPAQAKAIIDIHNGAVIAVAPVDWLERNISAAEQRLGTKAEAPQPPRLEKAIEPNQPIQPEAKQVIVAELEGAKKITASGEFTGQPEEVNEPEGSELFGRLLDSLAEAEKKAAEQGKQVSEANEPKTIATVSEPNEPNAAATVPEVNVPSEAPAGPAGQGPTEQLTDVELAEILRRLAALEAGLKAEPVEEIATEIEQPNEAEVEEVVPRIEQPNEVEVEEVVPRVEQPNEVEVEEVVPKIEHPKEVSEVNEVNEITEPVSKNGLYEPEPLANGEDVLVLNLPEKLTMEEFLGFMGEHLQLDYLYNPAEVKGDVTLRIHGQLKGPIKVSQLYSLFENVLYFNNFVMTRDENLVTIRKKASADIIDPPIVPAGGEGIVETGDVIITREFKLKHIDTASAQNLLKGMQLGIKVTPIQQTGTLFVMEYTFRMARIEKLLAMVDKPGEPKQFRLRDLKFTMAESLVPKVETLAEQLGTISVTVAAPRAPTAKPDPRKRTKATVKRGAAAPPKPTAKPTVYLEADKRTNRILMIGLAEQLDIVDGLIEALDVEQQDLRTLRLYQIEHIDAEEVRKKLGELGMVGGAGTAGRAPARTTKLTGAAAKSKAAAAAAARTRGGTAAKEELLVEEPQVVIIEPINSLLVNATPQQHVQISMIIGYVDSPTPETEIPYVVYPLENQAPEDLAGVLTQLIQETTSAQDKEGKIVTTTKKRREEDIVIIPDKNTFSLIVYASKKNQAWIKNLIKQLDKRRPQVLIDVTLVQITKDDIFNLDLDLLSSIPDLTYTSGITGESVVDLLLAPESNRDRFIDFGTTAGSFTGFYGDLKVNALLTAVETKRYGRVMARPKLLVNDNETGSIKTTDTTFVKRTSTNIIGTETPQTATQTVFDDYSAGITLEITPHISEGDMLRLEISLNRSGFTSALGGEIPPDKADADITTVVTVPDKSTIILGGVEKVQSTKGGEKVPILGDLPLLGPLFKTVARSEGQDKVYIFVKAHILRPGGDLALADLREVSRENREAFERLEREMGEYEDWPGIKPKPMDPLRILGPD
jgi:type II secretory pathway component GspD/PulD (secretin)